MSRRLRLILAIFSVLPLLAGCGAGALGAVAAGLAGGGGGGSSGEGAAGPPSQQPSPTEGSSPPAPTPGSEPPPLPPPSSSPLPPPPAVQAVLDVGQISDLVRAPDGHTFYCADSGKKQLLRLKVVEKTVSLSAPLDFTPGDIDIAPDGAEVYLCDTALNRVARFDVVTRKLTFFAVPAAPVNVACDNEVVYVSTRTGTPGGPQTYGLEIYDRKTGVLSHISNWTGDRLALDRTSRRLFVSPPEQNPLLRSYSVLSTVPTLLQERYSGTAGGLGLRLSPTGDLLAVRAGHASQLDKDGLGMGDCMPEFAAKDIFDIPGHYWSGSQPFDIVYRPGVEEVVTTAGLSYTGALWVHDLLTHRRLRRIDLSPWLATEGTYRLLLDISADGKILVVASTAVFGTQGKIFLVNADSGAPVELPYGKPLGYPETIAVGVISDLVSSPDGTKMYASDFAYDRVVVLDTLTNAVEKTFPVGSRPTGVDLDPSGRWLWVATRGATRLTVVDLLTDEVSSLRISGLPTDIAVGADGIAYASGLGPKGRVLSRVNTFGQFEIDAAEFGGALLGLDRIYHKLFTVDLLLGKIARYDVSGSLVLEQTASAPYTGGVSVKSVVLSPEGSSLLLPPAAEEIAATDLTLIKGKFSEGMDLALFSPSGKRVYMADSSASKTTVIVHDRETHLVVDYLPLGLTSTGHLRFVMGITADGSRIYVFSREGGGLVDGYLQWADSSEALKSP